MAPSCRWINSIVKKQRRHVKCDLCGFYLCNELKEMFIRQNTTMQCLKVRTWQFFLFKQNPADCHVRQCRCTHTQSIHKLDIFNVQRNLLRNPIHSVSVRFSWVFCVWLKTEQFITGNGKFTWPYPLYLIYVNYWWLFSIIMFRFDWCRMFNPNPMTTFYNEWLWISR